MDKPWNIFDFFIRESGSKCWPSSDPEDSPMDMFTCKLCGVSKPLTAYGGSYIGGPSFEDGIKQALLDHRDICPQLQNATIRKSGS